ncbi:glycoside hydrolase family 47 protein [Aspergillus stella-maris]|uniref:glycoside hydrolase family 47 protein n=1 Tax=Aspergillus stella-maris TaxID=1810926 RepID=UPI003CCE3A9D
MPSLNKRWSSFLTISAIFLTLFIFLHNANQVAIPSLPTRNRFTSNACPLNPPNPPYNRTVTDPESFSWRDIPDNYPVSDPISLSSDQPLSLPRIQASFPHLSTTEEETRLHRQNAIRETFQRAWRSYENHAWKADELRPITGGHKNTFGGWGATLVDNLDTLLIMGLDEEFERAVDALLDVDFNPHSSSQPTINLFETTIRYLGGFIAAYDLSGCKDGRLLDKAVQIGDMIYKSFDTPSRMPITRWNPHKAAGGEAQIPAAQGIIAEIASSSLELTRLSQLTGDMRYFDAISRITDILDSQAPNTRIPGMWPVGVDVQKPDLTKGSTFSFGGMADSAYEYLGKEFQLLGGVGRASQYQRLYEGALDAGARHLLFRPMVPDHADILLPGIAHATSLSVGLEPRAEHLSCFAGGMYALGGKLFGNDSHLAVGKKLADGCIWYYRNSPMGIMPEMFTVPRCPSLNECIWDDTQKSIYTHVRDKHYILRPEALESVFYMYRITGDSKYRDAAWDMFLSIDAATKTEFANAAVKDVTVSLQKHEHDAGEVEKGDPVGKEDSMESFWMAETLKYLYLIFEEEDVLSLDEFVFNTEAHPFRVTR